MFGPERFDSNNDFRNLIDVVVSYQATDKFALKANYDYGWEKNGAMYLPSSGDTATATGLNDKDASWQGLAVYAKYDIYDWWSLAARAEYFYDAQGVRTGVLVNNNGIDHLGLFEYTLTSEFKLFKNLIARLEYRYDKASNQVFFKDKTTSNNQSTIAAEMIYKF
jgi:predicted porin